MADDGWMPADYCEESSPPARATPTDWVVSDEQGRAGLSEEFGTKPAFLLEDGRQVEFLRYSDHGEATLTFGAGGVVVSSPMPVEAEHCCALDGLQADTLADSVDELITQLVEAVQPEDESEFRISYYSFEGPLPFRFDAATRSFVPVAS